jgi:hypothetical protein
VDSHHTPMVCDSQYLRLVKNNLFLTNEHIVILRGTMRRAIAATIAAGTIALILISALAAPAPQQDCSISPCTYLAIVMKPAEPTATATLVPLPTATTTATTEPTIGPTATPTLPPPTFNNCQADPNPNAAPNYPVRITAIDKSAETVTLRNETTGDTIDVTGWHMCSVTGNQEHPISGSLAPGEERTFPNTGGPIWNNNSSDPGVLYNSTGQLVSYFPD